MVLGLSPSDQRFAERRHAARLAAAQALYQLEFGGRGVEAVIGEFERHRFLDTNASDAQSQTGADNHTADDNQTTGDNHTDNDLGPTSVDDHAILDADTAFFGALVRGVVAQQTQIDSALGGVLAEGWSLRRIDATARAILRVAAYEILFRRDTAAAVILDSALGVADAFFAEAEPKFIHGALNSLALSARRDDPSGDAP